MKVVQQGTGKDLDSNNVALEQDERKRREFRDYSKQKITLEAVLNTVCKKCGCKGHFAQDCFVQPGGTKYNLVPEDDEDDEGDPKKTDKHVKKKKKEKKRKMHKKDREDSSGTESSSSSSSKSSDSEPSRKKRRHTEKSKKTSKKKKKKHKKHKQRD